MACVCLTHSPVCTNMYTLNVCCLSLRDDTHAKAWALNSTVYVVFAVLRPAWFPLALMQVNKAKAGDVLGLTVTREGKLLLSINNPEVKALLRPTSTNAGWAPPLPLQSCPPCPTLMHRFLYVKSTQVSPAGLMCCVKH